MNISENWKYIYIHGFLSGCRGLKFAQFCITALLQEFVDLFAVRHAIYYTDGFIKHIGLLINPVRFGK
jgi:hypothetical protein